MHLSDVTLASVAGVHVDAAQAALQRSMEGLEFAHVMLIASTPPAKRDPRIELIGVPPMSLRGYNLFMLQQFHYYVKTSHALTVHPDGFVVNPELWDPAWLGFDYLGAPWPKKIRVGSHVIPLADNRVGNSGFALRSHRLLELTSRSDLAKLGFPFMLDDLLTCFAMYEDLLEFGIKFADIETAARFSIESPAASFGHTLADTFGFHGKHYLAKLQEIEGAASNPNAPS